MTAARIHKLEASSVEVGEMLDFARALGPVLKMLEPDAKTKIATGLLTLLCVCHRAGES